MRTGPDRLALATVSWSNAGDGVTRGQLPLTDTASAP